MYLAEMNAMVVRSLLHDTPQGGRRGWCMDQFITCSCRTNRSMLHSEDPRNI